MVTYPNLSSLNNQSGIGGLMALPNSSYPYFWAWILAAIWAIISFTTYFKQKEKTGRGKMLSSMAVACLVVIFLSVIGTVIGIVSVDIMVYILVLGFIVIAIWFFTQK